jgi:hypothetical protein
MNAKTESVDAIEKLQTLVNRDHWQGNMSDLAVTLGRARESAPGLGVWLRRNEPTLWWTHGICVRFSRTGKRRLVHLSLRDGFAGSDSNPVIHTVTPEEDCTQSAVDVTFKNR